MNEDTPPRKLPLGKGVVIVPQAQLDPVLAVGGKGCKRSVLLLKTLEEHAIFIAPDEQRIPGEEAQNLVFQQSGYEILQLWPDDIVKGIEVGFALHGAADDAQGTKALQIVVDGIAGDTRFLSQDFQAPGTLAQPGEQLHPSAREDLWQRGGPVGEVQPLEGLRCGGAGQQDLAFRPLHQANILQAGYDTGDGAF